MKDLFAVVALLALTSSAFADSRLCDEFFPAKVMREKNLICTSLAGPLRFVESSVPSTDFLERPFSDLVRLNAGKYGESRLRAK
jgi:hypothetical protein